jgi:tetratricopeptide (TPR) repeat protein
MATNEADLIHFLAHCQVEQSKTWAMISKPNYAINAQKNVGLAINRLGELEKSYTKIPIYRESAAYAFLVRGEIREKTKEVGKAAEDFEAARNLLTPLVNQHADLPDLHGDLGNAHAGLGRVALALQKKDAAIHLGNAATEFRKARALSPTDLRFERWLERLPKASP